jgi:hypothetical protein
MTVVSQILVMKLWYEPWLDTMDPLFPAVVASFMNIFTFTIFIVQYYYNNHVGPIFYEFDNGKTIIIKSTPNMLCFTLHAHVSTIINW